MDFRFRDAQTRRDLQRLTDFLISQDLGYPSYVQWVERARAEIESGWKNVVLAFCEGYLVGDLISQPHKEIPRFLELKNMRVDPRFRNRYIARFMLRQAELDFGAGKDAIICDAPANQPEIIEFMESCGYSPLIALPLYNRNRLEVVMLKILKDKGEAEKSGLVLAAKDIVIAKSMPYN